MASPTLTYRFTIDQRDFVRAWLSEYYRRPGWRVLRIAMGPGCMFLGASMLGAEPAFNRVMGGVALAFGLYYALKPFLAVRMMAAQRRAAGRAELSLRLELDGDGLLVDDGRARTRFQWSEITAAGCRDRYYWYELRGGARATIPRSAVDDPEALSRLFRAHTRWVG